MKELAAILSDCISKFPMALCGLEKGAEVEKFVLNTPSTTPPEQVRIRTNGTNIDSGDIELSCLLVTGSYLYR